jgi:RNA 2',3'-cyclic 3'-phosphodiesterase
MFVALDLPEDARAALAEWRDRLVSGRLDLRPVRPEALHVTLVFLGWQAEKDADRIAEAVFSAAGGLEAPRLLAAGVRPLPPRRPRLFALDLADEEDRTTRLQGALSRVLEAERFYRPEKRPFWPHMTLARVKRGGRAEPLPEMAPPGEPFEAADLTLYRSTLRPQGALYEPLARARVGG